MRYVSNAEIIADYLRELHTMDFKQIHDLEVTLLKQMPLKFRTIYALTDSFRRHPDIYGEVLFYCT